jgi:hypothetical protein
MSVKPRRRKCLCCKRAFTPDYRNRRHQRYCSDPRCRRVSRLASQRRWRRKPENLDLDRGEHEVHRVQEWRQSHPGYWKQKSRSSVGSQPVACEPVNPEQRSRNVPGTDLPPLRDVWSLKNPVLVGLISMVTGSTLRDDIDATLRQVVCRGQNTLGLEAPETTNAKPCV